MFHVPPRTLRRVASPTCSRQCNGKLRGQEWAKHGHKGRAAWSPESTAAHAAKMRGPKNPVWRGGSYIEPGKGYRMIRMPNHARARVNGYVLQHIVIAEAMLGRPLAPGEEVHHRNEQRADNRPANLQVYATHREHWMTEHYETVAAARDAANSRKRFSRSPRP